MRRHGIATGPSIWMWTLLAALVVPSTANAAASLERVSVAPGGIEGNGWSGIPAISADGRYVAFVSEASNLVPDDTNGVADVFRRDRTTGTTLRMSVSSDGEQADLGSKEGTWVAIASDGSTVAFHSYATNLVSHDLNGVRDVFVRDVVAARTEPVSVSTNGASGGALSGPLSMSGDGRFVAFVSETLTDGAPDGGPNVFVRDRLNETTTLASVAATGKVCPPSGVPMGCQTRPSDPCGAGLGGSVNPPGFRESANPSISDDGRFVAFASSVGTLVAGDTNCAYDVFVRDLLEGITERISVDSEGRQAVGFPMSVDILRVATGVGDPVWGGPSWPDTDISGDGRYVVFESDALNLVLGDTNRTKDIFIRDRLTHKTERVSVGDSGGQGDNESAGPLTVSDDGRFVSFVSVAANLVANDSNAAADVFVRDRVNGVTQRVSLNAAGGEASGPSYIPAMSRMGQFVAFTSDAEDLVSDDRNGVADVFVWAAHQ